MIALSSYIDYWDFYVAALGSIGNRFNVRPSKHYYEPERKNVMILIFLTTKHTILPHVTEVFPSNLNSLCIVLFHPKSRIFLSLYDVFNKRKIPMDQRMVKLRLSIFYAAELGVKSQKKNI